LTLENYEQDPLWPILVDTVHAMIMFKNQLAYTRDVLIHEDSNISIHELSSRLGIPLGEAMVILHEIRKPKVT
jgi:hypothetical protein